MSGGVFSTRELSRLTGINNSSTVRRALLGLIAKLSIERAIPTGGEKMDRQGGRLYRIFSPVEIFERRRAFGLPFYPAEVDAYGGSNGFSRAVECVALDSNLSRREAQVALACAGGMTNVEIGRRLATGEQTVKFHLRNIFVKFGVRRRTELISRLLVSGYQSSAGEKNQGQIKVARDEMKRD